MKRLILLGAGKCGREVLQIALEMNKTEQKWDFFAFLDYNADGLSDKNCVAKVIGTDDDYIIQERDEFICTVGNSIVREKIVTKMENKGAVFTNIIHPSAIVSDTAELKTGIIIYPNSIVTADAFIGNNCIINMNCTVAHDVYMDDYCTVSPGCNITGGCKIGKHVFFGVGANLIPNIKVGENAMICAGSTVMTHIKANRKAMGNPAKTYKQW